MKHPNLDGIRSGVRSQKGVCRLMHQFMNPEFALATMIEFALAQPSLLQPMHHGPVCRSRCSDKPAQSIPITIFCHSILSPGISTCRQKPGLYAWDF
ncbi:hypothetical protein TNIN_284251 [Trichonephila inaurata madagascariensis]|uniref:Uncharacterized protein n=1 Tax=Trichonephila inaurata madagascariensis TaxID=2747483 RepID=A0A8X6XRE3_9ARAC|nr:hypothetical protein TNIN_284251 [Trichonephila inaurata madagascariensis]